MMMVWLEDMKERRIRTGNLPNEACCCIRKMAWESGNGMKKDVAIYQRERERDWVFTSEEKEEEKESWSKIFTRCF